jgi:isochorismate pyruvate lyase
LFFLARKGAAGVKSPNECRDIQDIRAEIDRIDREVIDLLGQRFQYVQAAAPFKTSAASVRAPERFQAMLQQRRHWAAEAGLAPDAIEKMYRDLVQYFIEEEMKTWKTETGGGTF